MKLLKKVAMAGYAITGTAGIVIGFIYSFANRIMPYHLQALGSTWEELSIGTQWVTLNYVRGVGAGFLSSSTAMLIILLGPFRKGEFWSYWSIFVVSTLELGLITLVTYSTKVNTSAEPPLTGLLILLAVIFISFVLSMISTKKSSDGE